MYQIILSSKKVNVRILQEINDIESEKLQLFDKIKNANQTDAKCIAIRDALRQNKKN
jgi:hypothetical protein